MNQVTVSKSRLLDTLRVNRDEHRDIFTKAQTVYRQRMIEELDRALAEAKAGRKIIRAFSLPVPEDHTDDFDTAIQMVEWEIEDEITLAQHEFTQYVLNNWAWRASFGQTTAAYVS